VYPGFHTGEDISSAKVPPPLAEVLTKL